MKSKETVNLHDCGAGKFFSKISLKVIIVKQGWLNSSNESFK